MKLNLKVHWLKQLKEAGSTDLSEIYKWRDDANWCEVEIEKFTELDLTSLAKMAQASKEKGSKSALIKINTYNKLKTDLTGTVITRLSHWLRQCASSTANNDTSMPASALRKLSARNRSGAT